MTRINRLFARGLKCGDFDHQLQAVNLIVGRNFSGKTTRLEAVQLALIGYVPELGKPNTATMALCRNGSIEVGIETDQGSITRTWKKGKTIKAEISSTGNISATPAVLMDSREYFNLGPKDQVRYVFARCDVEKEFSAEKITAAIKNIKLAENTQQTEAALGKVISLVEDTDYLRRDHDESVQTWLEDLTAQLRDRLKTAKANADAMTSLVKGMTGLQATEAGAALTDVSREIAAVRAKINEASVQARQIIARVSEEEAKEKRRAILQEQLSGTVLADLEKSKATTEALIKELADKVAGYQSKTTDIQCELVALRSQLAQVQFEQSTLDRECRADDAKTKALTEKPCCPTCGSKKNGWQSEIEKALAERQEERRRRMAECDQTIIALRKDIDTITMLIASSQDVDAQHNLARESQRSASNNLHSIEVKIVQRQNAEKAMADLGEPVDIKAEQERFNAISQEASDLNAKLAVLDAKQKAFVQAQQDTKRMAQAMIQAKAVEADVLVLKESVKVIETLQVEMVDKSLGAILTLANMVVGTVVPWRLEYNNGSLGRFDGKTWISHEVFSGLEKAIAYSGISVALSKDAPIRIVLIDEALIDRDSREKLLGNMLRLTESGVLDQFILVDVNDEFTPDGVNVIRT